MDAYIAASREFYTTAWLKAMCRRYGIETVGRPESADVLLVSVCDVEDYSLLRRLRKQYPAKPIIAGGLQVGTGNGLALAYADAVVVGEGQASIAMLGSVGLRGLHGLACVMDKAKASSAIIPSEKLDFAQCPVVQINNRVWYALAARGCPTRCAFCWTSWATPYRKAASRMLERVAVRIRQRGKGERVTWITNDGRRLPMVARNAQSMSLRYYIEHPEDAVGLTALRLGIEGFCEARRAWYGKPITNAELREAIALAGASRTQLELFFIVGWDTDTDELEEFISEALPYDEATGPRVWCKFTHFAASPFTPLWTVDVSRLVQFDHATAWRRAVARNRRIRYYKPGNISNALWRSMLNRVRWQDAGAMSMVKPPSQQAPDEYLESIRASGLLYTIAPGPDDELPGARVAVKTAVARDRRAAVLGMVPLKRPMEPTGEPFPAD